MMGTVPGVVVIGTLSAVKLVHILCSKESRLNVVVGDAVAVPVPELPDDAEEEVPAAELPDEFEITVVAGAFPPPPPPAHAARTNTLAAAAERLANKFRPISPPFWPYRLDDTLRSWSQIVPYAELVNELR
jgi:hypothetical protein